MHAEAVALRLQEERKRLSLNQSDFADHAGVSKRTQAAYEAGTSEPGIGYLRKVAELGVDVWYLITGAPAAISDISRDEQELVTQYRLLNGEDRSAVMRLIRALARCN